jgi:transcriptional regulator with XRE-family HTH domain
MFQGKRLRQLRESRGLTQDQLAALVGTERENVSRYETGGSTPKIETLGKLANALCTTVDYLLGRTESPHGLSVAEARAEYFTPTGNIREDRRRRELYDQFMATGHEMSLRDLEQLIKIAKAIAADDQKKKE